MICPSYALALGRVKAVAIFILGLFAAASCPAQLMDSLPGVIRAKYSIDARLESRLCFIGENQVSVNGVRLGVAWQRKLRLGGGFSWLNTEVRVPVNPFPTNTGIQDFKFLKFGYLCYYIDFVFHKTKRWQLSVPLQGGAGLIWLQRKQLYNLFSQDTKYFMLLYEPGVTVQFKIFKWFGLGNDIAYRFVFKSRKSGQALNAPTYSLKILFWPDLLFYDLFPRSRVTKYFGPAYW
jgi:hypothetical protein